MPDSTAPDPLAATVSAAPRVLLLEGIRHHQAGRHAAAERAYHAAHRAAPQLSEPLRLLGILAHQGGAHDRAAELLFEACRRCPQDAACRGDLAIALAAGGQLAAARACLQQAIAMRPDDAPTRVNLAQLLLRPGANGRPAPADVLEAEAQARAALALDPRLGLAHSTLGVALREQQRLAEAEQALLLARELAPNSAQVANNLGNVLSDLGRRDEAEATYRAALAGDADLVEAHNNLGRLLRQANRLDEAEACLRQALALSPACVEAHVNLGNVLADLGRYDEAEAAYAAALARAPEHPEAIYDLGALHLVTGRLRRGWAGYEARWQRRGFAPRQMAAPAWQGEPRAGRTLLLHAEQGLGDTIQFCRFIPGLCAEGPVILEAPPVLHGLLGSLTGDIRLIAPGAALPTHALQLALPSLPGVLGVELADIPACVPYLHADAARVAGWRARIAGLPGLRVGLAWAGNPDYALDSRRSLDVAALAPLAALAGVSFISMQKCAAAPDWMYDASAGLDDFADTAGLVTALDLVISVDTAVVHLAGALGRPTWLLNRFDTCWRWLLERTDSPWYPTLRIFRQPAPFAWAPVLDEVAARLADLAGRAAGTVAAGRRLRYSAA
jgi:tetratricopeptide (TPR) repeat protein